MVLVCICVDLVCIVHTDRYLGVGMYHSDIGLYWHVLYVLVCMQVDMYWYVMELMVPIDGYWLILCVLVGIGVHWYVLACIVCIPCNGMYCMFWYILVCTET